MSDNPAACGDAPTMLMDSAAILRHGTPRQQQAYLVLMELGIFDQLAPYDPVVAGTIPLRIDTPASDLDVLCHVSDLARFGARLDELYGNLARYARWRSIKDGLPVCLCTFTHGGFPIELFGQPRPTREQRAYLHMVAEARLLNTARQLDNGADSARAAIRHMKQSGLKTEPAFGHYFALPGDPYETLLRLARAPRAELVEIVCKSCGSAT